MKKMETPAGYRPYPTTQERKEERRRINAFLKESRMTRKKFAVRLKEITEATELTQAKKAEKILYLSNCLIEDSLDRTPEMRDWKKRESVEIQKHAGHGGFSFCPESGQWYPDRPPAIKALEREWEELKNRKIGETYRKAMNRKAA